MLGPLAGIKVVDLTMWQQGPVAAMLLGDMGADVIKIEPPSGEPARGVDRILDQSQRLKGRNYYFENHNRNKRSITLDMKKPAGREIFFKLIDRADVFVTNVRIGVPEKMGIAYDVLEKRNPRLVYAHASGWGAEGPDATKACQDYTGIARAGLMMLCGDEGEPPARIGAGLADELGGMVCAWAICAALYNREKTGLGQRVDTSLFGSMIAMESLLLSHPAIVGTEFPRGGSRARIGNPLYYRYQCQDGKWLVIAHLQSDRYWPGFCRALEITDLEHDKRFENKEARSQNSAALMHILEEKFASRPRGQWLSILDKEGLIFTPVQSPLEVINDPQAAANDYIIWYNHPVLGRTKMVGFPWRFSRSPVSVRREPPQLGQHTEEVLLELGYTWEDITRFKDEGAV